MTFHCRCKFQTPSLSAFLAHWQEAHGVRVQDTSPRTLMAQVRRAAKESG